MKLKAFQDGKCWIIWCHYCKRYHTHGNPEWRSGEAGGDGHRVAHCSPDSPYNSGGYELVDAGRAPEWMVEDYNRWRPRGRP